MTNSEIEIFADTFKDKTTERIWEGDFLKKGLSQQIQQRAQDKMTWLFAFGYSLEEIEKLFGSKNFEHLKGERDDECSIRVNKQYRICFKWKPTRPYEIEFNKHYWD